MKIVSIFLVLLAGSFAASGQNEQSPIVEKDIVYKNWTYKSISTGEPLNLRDLAMGKKLVMVVYFAPWCPNWRHDAPMVERLYQKYKNSGFGVVAVGEYDPLASMKNNLEFLKVTFPAVYESELRTDKQKTLHYEYRKAAGDTRGWGSPWYIFLEPGKFDKKSDVLTSTADVVNGELVQAEGEKFIREKLGLAGEKLTYTSEKAGIAGTCEHAKPTASLNKTQK